MTVRVRFAPSPTGPLHIGGARTVLFNWLFARRQGGKMLLRSEDTDLERSDVKWEQAIAENLRWLGLEWDEGLEVGGANGPYRQTERLEIYKEYLGRLWLGGHVYYCFCTAEELAAQRQQGEGSFGYSGRCRHLAPQEVEQKLAEGLKPTIRFKVPKEKTVVFQDLIRGEVSVDTSDISDFVIIKSDGIPTYNFAVVVDDLTMGITHVIRANEHLTNTPNQILIYDALGEDTPEFAHVSLILDETGRKMSKRMGDMSVEAYARRGYLPEAIVNFLALLGWSPDEEKEIMPLEEIVSRFDLERVSKSPAVFDFKKLDWLNNQYLQHADLDYLVSLSHPHLEAAGIDAKLSDEWLAYVLGVVRDELNNLSEFPEHVKEYLSDTVIVSPEAKEHLLLESTPLVLDALTERLKDMEKLEQDACQQMLKQLNKDLKKSAGVSGKAVFMPIRVALSGATSGQELYYLLPILGRERALRRIESAQAQAGI
ncbi:MAG: glutamate--tRNA ligase [Firmicutes bacterium]|nr:glutamate--tRNA ligase [Bacillota bacterium]